LAEKAIQLNMLEAEREDFEPPDFDYVFKTAA
jgi:hypothetical protein